MTVNELCLVFLKHAETHYRRPDGTPTDELANVKYTVKALRKTHGDRPAAEFGPLALKAVRDAMVGRGWCRRNVNMHTRRVNRIFRHGVENEMVPPSVLEGLKAVSGLQAGRTAAREIPPVLPVDIADVSATLAHLNRHVRGIVEFQRLTGCRPGEACSLRWCDIDKTADVWVYRWVYRLIFPTEGGQ